MPSSWPHTSAHVTSGKSLLVQATGWGRERQRVHPEALLELKVWIPPMDVQRQVVANLDRLGNALGRRQHLLGVLGALESAALNRMMAGS